MDAVADVSPPTLEELRIAYTRALLLKHSSSDGRVKKVAETMGVSMKTVYNWIANMEAKQNEHPRAKPMDDVRRPAGRTEAVPSG